jgi:hypothetical protein
MRKKVKIDSISELIQFIIAIDDTQNELYEMSKPHKNKECFHEESKSNS